MVSKEAARRRQRTRKGIDLYTDDTQQNTLDWLSEVRLGKRASGC